MKLIPEYWLELFVLSVVILNNSVGSADPDSQNATIDFECDVLKSENSKLLRNDLINLSPFYGILVKAKHYLPSDSDCLRDVKTILDGIESRDVWAIKMHDASGIPGSNFVSGQKFWHGSEASCMRLNEKPRNPLILDYEYDVPKLIEATAPFCTNYAVIYANLTSPYQLPLVYYVKIPLELGVCVPGSCSTDDLFNVSKIYFQNRELAFQKMYNLDVKVIEVKKLSFTRFLERSDTQSIVGGIGLAVLVVMLFNLLPRGNKGSVLERIQNCFNLTNNYKNLMSMDIPENSIVAIDSTRVLTCLLIMAAHMLYFSIFSYSNASDFMFGVNHLSTQILFVCIVYVDTFFVVSSFLLVYNFLRNAKQMEAIRTNSLCNNIKLFFKQLLHRYLRLTPAIILTMAIGHLVAVFLKETSIFYIADNIDMYCPKNSWWRSLLYIQGHFPIEEMCGTWTWYLSCDMHYFVICLIGLFVYVKYPTVAKVLFFMMSIASISVSWYVNQKVNFTFNVDQAMALRDTIYSSPRVRMNPYFGGVIGGYIFHKYKSDGLKVNTYTYYFWLLTSFGIFAGLILVFDFQEHIPLIAWSFNQSFGRYFIGLYFAWSIFVLHFSQGYIQKFMSHKLFYHLSKLTYMIYLIDPIVVAFIQGIRSQPGVLQASTIYIELIGVTVICYVLSVVCHLFFEVPYCKLSSEFVMKRPKPLKTNS